jgi:hypothetical protein
VVRAVSRNEPCPCGSGRKFKRCCQEAQDNPASIAQHHDAVGSKIQAWASEHYGEEIAAAFEDVVGGGEGIVLGDDDLHLIGTWALSERELSGGETIARRCARRADLSDRERDIARRIAGARLTLLRIDRVVPDRCIAAYDLTLGEQVIISSHDVSRSVRSADVIVGRLMAGPPAPTLWGPVAVLDHASRQQISELLQTRVRSRSRSRARADGLGDRRAQRIRRDHRTAGARAPRVPDGATRGVTHRAAAFAPAPEACSLRIRGPAACLAFPSARRESRPTAPRVSSATKERRLSGPQSHLRTMSRAVLTLQCASGAGRRAFDGEGAITPGGCARLTSEFSSTMPLVLPAPDVARIQELCESRVPPEAQEHVRVELEHERQAVNIVERRPPWRPDYGPEWSRLPIARLRYVASKRLWTLNYHRHTGRWERYPLLGLSRRLTDLLTEIAEDPICAFWG